MEDLDIALALADLPDFESGFAGVPGVAQDIDKHFDAIPADFAPIAGIEAAFEGPVRRRAGRFTNKFHRMEFVRSKRTARLAEARRKKHLVKYSALKSAWDRIAGSLE